MIRTTISSARTVNMQVKDVKVEASARNLRLIRDAVAGAAADPAAPGSAAKLLCAAACLDDLIAAAEGRDLLKATLPRRIFLKPAARKAKQ